MKVVTLAAIWLSISIVPGATPLARAAAPDPTLTQPQPSPSPSLTNIRGVWVMNLYGSQIEMARQHGSLVRGQYADTVLPFFARKIDNAIEQSYLVKDYPLLGPAAREGVDLWVRGPLRRRLPKSDLDALAAFSLASGFNFRQILNAFVVPDVGQWLTTSIFGSNKPTLGCSSVILATSADGLVHARNLDYEGYGIFDRHPLVIHFHPDGPGEQDYTSITSLGVHTAGITATNASGLTLDLHQTLVGAVSRLGTPILSITSRVIREARNLRQAIKMLRAAHYAGSWLIVLSSARERRAAIVEVSADGAAVRLMTGSHFAATNHVLTPWMAKKEFSVDYGFYASTRERLKLLDREASDALTRGTASVQSALDMISSAPVSLMTNIQSVVLAPERNLLYVAVDPIEGARPVDGRYVALPLDGKGPATGVDLSRSNPLTQAQLEATALLRKAGQISTEEARFEESAELLDRAAALDPKDATYPLLGALTLFRAAPAAANPFRAQALLALAETRLHDASARRLTPYQTSLAALMTARLADIRTDRAAALRGYALVNQSFWGPLAHATRSGLKRPYGLRELRKLVVDYERADLFRF